jgi:hypothetical protein
MKYNPKVNEEVARVAGFAQLHPYTPENLSQGALRLMVEFQDFLVSRSLVPAKNAPFCAHWVSKFFAFFRYEFIATICLEIQPNFGRRI